MRIDLTGRIFENLTVLRRAPSLKRANGGPLVRWVCRCACGQEVVVRTDKLRSGKRKACGVNGHFFRIRSEDHRDEWKSPERRSWDAMWKRCTKDGHKNFNNYGGRGIKVCDDWKNFYVFLFDMGPRPSLDYSIERIDVNGDYEPGNCKWATKAEQDRNKRNNVYVEYEGERVLLMDVVAKLGVDRGIVYGRLRSGWPLEEALAVPVRPTKTLADGRKRKVKS